MATIHTLMIDDKDITVHVAATEEALYEILRDNYGDGYDPEADGDLVEFVLSQGVTFVLDQHTIPLEILHVRDPDSSCDSTVYFGGVVTSYAEESVDPGAGYVLKDWKRETKRIKKGEYNYSPAFRDAVVTSRKAANDSEYMRDEE